MRQTISEVLQMTPRANLLTLNLAVLDFAKMDNERRAKELAAIENDPNLTSVTSPEVLGLLWRINKASPDDRLVYITRLRRAVVANMVKARTQ
jgi:hypothetical protein